MPNRGKYQQYQVEALLGRRLRQGHPLEYLVKWTGYPESESTWEPLQNLTGCLSLVAQYDKEHPLQYVPSDRPTQQPQRRTSRRAQSKYSHVMYLRREADGVKVTLEFTDINKDPVVLTTRQLFEEDPDLLLDYYLDHLEIGPMTDRELSPIPWISPLAPPQAAPVPDFTFPAIPAAAAQRSMTAKQTNKSAPVAASSRPLLCPVAGPPSRSPAASPVQPPLLASSPTNPASPTAS